MNTTDKKNIAEILYRIFPNRIVLRTGKYILVLVILAVALNYWEVLSLDKIPIPHFVDILYGYMLIHGLAIGTYSYLGTRVRAIKMCPQCDTLLEIAASYICPNCGKLEFK